MEERLNRKAAGVLCTLQLVAGIAFAAPQAFDYSFIESKLEAGAENQVEFREVSDTPVVYRAWGIWNYAHPMQEVAAAALDFDHYTRIFPHVYRCDRIVEPKHLVSTLGTRYVEGRAAFARVWAIGSIDTIRWPDTSHLRVIARQTEDGRLEATWGRRERGWLNFRTHGVRLAAFVVASGQDSCRVGIVVQGWVKDPMPQWLVRMAVKIILPSLLKDLDNEVQRRARESKPKETPWYGRWYKAVKHIFSGDKADTLQGQ
jgi:hypothetical protein